MYVKIIKCDNVCWYSDHLYAIYEVEKEKEDCYYVKTRIDGYANISKQDCEIIDFPMDNNQISEKFADELLSVLKGGKIVGIPYSKKEVKYIWKQQGYIKQSREEEIKERLKDKNLYNENIIELQKELIKLYEGKLNNDNK